MHDEKTLSGFASTDPYDIFIAAKHQEKQDSSQLFKNQKFDPYSQLRQTFEHALFRATGGKGAERHNRPGVAFERQPLMEIQRMLGDVGLGGPLFQIIKKCQEASRLSPAGAIRELQDVMVYAAAAIMKIKEQHGENPE